MVSLKELKTFMGKKVKDFAMVNGNNNFSIVFEDNTLLKFTDEPYECGRVEDIGPVKKPKPEKPQKEKKPLLERINNLVNKIWIIFKIALKIGFIGLILFIGYIIYSHWGDITSLFNQAWGFAQTWIGTN